MAILKCILFFRKDMKEQELKMEPVTRAEERKGWGSDCIHTLPFGHNCDLTRCLLALRAAINQVLSYCSWPGSQVFRTFWGFCNHFYKMEGQNPWATWWVPCQNFSVATQKEVDPECFPSTGMRITTTKLSWGLTQQGRNLVIFMIIQPVSFPTNPLRNSRQVCLMFKY